MNKKIITTNKALQALDVKTKAIEILQALDVSEATRKDYQYRIGAFLDTIKDGVINKDSFLNFKRYLKERSDYSVATKNKYLATAKIFLKELNRQEDIPVDITQNIKSFNQSKKHKREGFNKKEINQIIKKLNLLPVTPRNARLKAFFCLLAFQGLRQIEIIRLDVKDINLVSKTASVQGKGRDDKELVYLHLQTIKALRIHLKVNKAGSGAVFKSLSNRKSDRITTMTVKREIKKLINPLNIEKSTHGFRHYFITSLLEKLSVRDVRKFSRHKSLEMLIVYDDEIDMKHKTSEVFKCFGGLQLTG